MGMEICKVVPDEEAYANPLACRMKGACRAVECAHWRSDPYADARWGCILTYWEQGVIVDMFL